VCQYMHDIGQGIKEFPKCGWTVDWNFWLPYPSKIYGGSWCLK
jgi:hypothetical protein